MKNLNQFIEERLKLDKDTKINNSKYHPKNYDELKDLIKELLEELGKDADLNDIDVSEITDMSGLFRNLDPHNIDISKWNVSRVVNMRYMFYGCKNFDCDLSDWKVSKTLDMKCMFVGCTSLKNRPSWYKKY